MSEKKLKNPPLLEAIFEIRWKTGYTNIKIVPNYEILIDEIYEQLEEDYPHYEQLVISNDIPDEIYNYMIQDRFRVEENQWPLIQLAPGIITLNDTEKYTWQNFEEKIIKLLNIIEKIYPNAKDSLKIDNISLRYINVKNVDFSQKNILEFLKNNMNIDIKLNPNLYNNKIKSLPTNINLEFSFSTLIPKGTIGMHLGRGKREANDVLIWEIIMKSELENLSSNKNEIISWLKDAHNIVKNWFFESMEDNFRKEFE